MSSLGSNSLWLRLKHEAPFELLDEIVQRDARALRETVPLAKLGYEARSGYCSLLAACLLANKAQGAVWLLRFHHQKFNMKQMVTPARKSLLELAIDGLMTDVIPLLVERGADLWAENDAGQIPLTYAKEELSRIFDHVNRMALVSLLEELTFRPTGTGAGPSSAVGSARLSPRQPSSPLGKGTPPQHEAATARALPDLSVLLLEEEGYGELPADFHIEVEGGEARLPCHTGILRSRSSFFRGLLDSSMREPREGLLRLHDVTAVEMGWVLQSMYSGRARPVPTASSPPTPPANSEAHGDKEDEEEEPMAIRLLRLVDRFDLGFLKDGLEEDLAHCITAANVLDIQACARRSNAQQLCWSCTDFILQHLSEVAAVAASDAEHSLALSLALKEAGPLTWTRTFSL